MVLEADQVLRNLTKALVRIDTICQNNCLFCLNRSYRTRTSSASIHHKATLQKIHIAKEQNIAMIILSGGEPTISPAFKTYCALIQQKGMKIGLASNLLVFSHPKALEYIHQFDIQYIHTSLHGATCITHDSITRHPGSFDRFFKALHNLSTVSVYLSLNWVITRTNISEMQDALIMLSDFNIQEITFSYPSFRGLLPQFQSYYPSFEECIPFIQELAALSSPSLPPFYFYQFPLCSIPNHSIQHPVYHINDHHILLTGDIDEPYFNRDTGVIPDCMFPASCSPCTKRRDGSCPGIEPAYYEYFPRFDVKPF